MSPISRNCYSNVKQLSSGVPTSFLERVGRSGSFLGPQIPKSFPTQILRLEKLYMRTKYARSKFIIDIQSCRQNSWKVTLYVQTLDSSNYVDINVQGLLWRGNFGGFSFLGYFHSNLQRKLDDILLLGGLSLMMHTNAHK